MTSPYGLQVKLSPLLLDLAHRHCHDGRGSKPSWELLQPSRCLEHTWDDEQAPPHACTQDRGRHLTRAWQGYQSSGSQHRNQQSNAPIGWSLFAGIAKSRCAP